MTLTDCLLAHVAAELERQRSALDGARGVVAVVVTLDLNRQGAPADVRVQLTTRRPVRV